MASRAGKTAVSLGEGERARLERLARTRTAQAGRVARARILLLRDSGEGLQAIADKVGLSKPSVCLCISKWREGGVEAALADGARGGRPREIDDADRAFVLDLACQRPADLGHAAELWTNDLLTAHVRRAAEAAGHPRLATVSTGTVHNILAAGGVRPHKVSYYCERRDPDFEAKMHNVLLLYRQLSFRFAEDGSLLPWGDGREVHVLSYDEKPGIRATANTAPDLRPDASAGGGAVGRDYEYRRLGTLSLLAAIDLLTGEAVPLVSETHRSSDYVGFLRGLDRRYPEGHLVRIVLDNVSVHTSAETRAYLATVPGRFDFVFTPKHGSWLNLVEGFFSKMTRQMLRGIRVSSKEELAERIYRYFDEVNEEPVVHRWRWNLSDIDPVGEELKVVTLLEDTESKVS